MARNTKVDVISTPWTFVKDNLLAVCDVKTKENCNEKETEYITKMSAKKADALPKELKRLEGMKGGDMKPEKKAWLSQRITLLKGMTAAAEGKTDL